MTSAGLSYDSAAEQYDDALDALDDLEVVAPCDGIVWNVTVEVGDSVTASGGESSGSNSESTAGGDDDHLLQRRLRCTGHDRTRRADGG